MLVQGLSFQAIPTIKIACIAQIVNVISPILTTRSELLKQSTFIPFVMFAKRAKGWSLLKMLATGRTEIAIRPVTRGKGDEQTITLTSRDLLNNLRMNIPDAQQIRISPVFLIDQDDNKVGSTTTSEALRRAREAGLDLVEVAPNARPPVCCDSCRITYSASLKSFEPLFPSLSRRPMP